MLRELSIKNFAIIENETLRLGEGLNVLTGETGAGKSIMIEALGFLLGDRGSSSWLRSGTDRLEVGAVFDAKDFPKEIRSQFKITLPTVMIRRELDASGKTRAIINSQSAPVSALASLGEGLVDFHGQHEHQTLVRPSAQLELLDGFGGLADELDAARTRFETWSRLRSELESASMSDEERRKRVELARWQLQELTEAKLKVGEDEELEAALPRLKNAERLRAMAGGAYELLYGQEGSILGGLLKAERALAELSKIDESMRPAHDELESARLSLEDISHRLGDYHDKLGADPSRLDAILSRQDALSRLKKKYGPSVDELIAARERAAAEVARLENSQESLKELEEKLAQAQKGLDAACEALHKARVKAAKSLEAKLLKELKMLGMASARFSVSVELEEGRYTRLGGDSVEFMLAANPGEQMRRLSAVASGGELSRVMLALKTVLASADRVPVLVFDEVDAGIGGTVARAVGQKLANLGQSRQVLCVTHLPQVACFGREHFQVMKEVAGGRTKVGVTRLDGKTRLEAIALMLGGREATPASRKHAQELLESSTQ
ncbi:MAG: DNA repair protein RecN [Elusimicrobia bacterium]|nr:DNA repair protein RecN [Elusimicrobiota bacterium]